MEKERTVSLLLRLGVAFSFLYPAVDGIARPDAWVGFFPPFMLAVVPATYLLPAFEALEITLALLILFMKDPRYPSFFAALILFGVVVFNLGTFDIVFRDVAILLMALALVVSHKEERLRFN